MRRKIFVQITKLVSVFSVAVFLVTPVRGGRHFAVLGGSVLVFLICFLF